MKGRCGLPLCFMTGSPPDRQKMGKSEKSVVKHLAVSQKTPTFAWI